MSHASTVLQSSYQKEFEKRRAWFISLYDSSKMVNYNVIAARYATGNNVKLADEMFEKLLQEPRGDMFWMYRVIGCYLLGKDKMSAKTRKAVREAWRTYAPSRGDTENHWALYYTCLLLAAEQWPGEAGNTWFDGASSSEKAAESKEYLIHWIKLTTTIGQGEFDSPDYLHMFLIASTLLAEFSTDPEMRKRGEMLTDYLLADYAVEHIDQLYAGGHSRIYERNLMQPKFCGASTIAYFYFATGAPQRSGWMLYPLLTSYRMPEIIYQIATDRSKPYVHREIKRVRHVIRYGEERNPKVFKTTYMTQDYALGSLHGGMLQPIQQLTWSVKYRHGRPTSMIFGLHPYWSIYEIGMFFPEEMKTVMAAITASKTTYNNPDKWTGGSPFERTFQYKSTLLALYDIPAGTTSEHIDGFFPANLDERILDDSGWILCKAGDTYVAWYPLQPAVWSEEYQKAAAAFNEGTSSRANDGSLVLRNHRLRSHELQNGYVVEVQNREEAGSFEQFCAAVRSRIPEAVFSPDEVKVAYKTIHDDEMEFVFPDTRRLNGSTYELDNDKLFSGPYLNADHGSEKLKISHGKKELSLDFKKLEKTEK